MITEVELKYEVTAFTLIRNKLLDLGGQVVHSEEHERNIVFDSLDGSLKAEGKLLRLRKYGDKVLLTVKKPFPSEMMKIRLEHESSLTMSFKEAVQMINALNFKEVFLYEKTREIWQLDSIHICLDTLFFGNFVEIEGNTVEEVERISLALGFDIKRGIKSSYRTLQIAAEKRNFVKS